MTSISDKIARRVAERNSWSTYSPKTFKDVFKMLRENRPDKTLPNETWLNKNFPVKNIDWESLRNYPNSSTTKNSIQATWIGHATVFVQMGKFKILTDPIFSDRCSGVQWAGPKRYRPPACTLQDLLVKEKIGVDVVLISHNHYDHLDYNSVKELAQLAISQNQPIEFVVPLGLRKWFEKHIPLSLKGGNKVTELDWHESYVIRKESNNEMCLSVTPVPMQHWSNRYGYDRDLTLWCGFSVKAFHENNNSNNDDGSKSCSFLFTGDTGLFDEATKIGQQYGPFDLAAIPIGAYEPRWFMKQEHMNPQDAVEFMDAVQAKKALAIHWGTFALTTEPVLEPKEKLFEEMEKAGKDVKTFAAPFLGETVLSD